MLATQQASLIGHQEGDDGFKPRVRAAHARREEQS
jgi:hypothetical protein